jgi:hypothetical protein
MKGYLWAAIGVATGSTVAVAQVAKPDRIDAMTAPSRDACNLFSSLNHPAMSPEKLSGEPDLQRRMGDAGLTVWETWTSAGSEVFFPNGGALVHGRV